MLEAVTPKPALQVEGEDARVDNRYLPPLLFDFPGWDADMRERMLKDDRVRGHQERSIFNVRDAEDRLG